MGWVGPCERFGIVRRNPSLLDETLQNEVRTIENPERRPPGDASFFIIFFV